MWYKMKMISISKTLLLGHDLEVAEHIILKKD